MGALFSRIKVWVSAEDVVYSDLNAEFDNLLNNLTAANVDDFSTNVSQMQSTTDPGEVGSESLATSVAGEIARLRHLIKEITGETQWYTSPDASISTLASLLGTGLQDNRIASGRVRATSQQPIFLQPLGSNRTITLVAASTPFVYYVDGTQYTISSNVTLTSLTAAPTANNTALINDSLAADQVVTKYAGEDGSVIPIDNAGTEVTALVGKFAAFRLDNGSTSEYLTAYVESSTRLTKAKRGYFFDSTDTPVQRIVYSDNDTLHLLKLTWIFAKTDGTLTATYTTPAWSKDEPSSPAANDYWFDMANATWKKYDVSSFIAANATLIGACAQNTTATIGARSFEFFQAWEESNTVELIKDSNSQVKSRFPGSTVSVWGTSHKYEHNLINWDMTLDMDSGVAEAANTHFFFYVTEGGDKVISDIRPYDRREDLRGYYHPHHSWRCVGQAFNDASQNLTLVSSEFKREQAYPFSNTISTNVNVEVVSKITPVNSSVAALNVNLPPAAYWKDQEKSFIKVSSDYNAINIVAASGEFISSPLTDAVNTTINTKGEILKLTSDGANVYVVHRYIPSDWSANAAVNISATTTPPAKNNAPLVDLVKFKREGPDLIGMISYRQNAAGTIGSGDYLFGLVPVGSGLVIDPLKVRYYATVEGAGAYQNNNIVGIIQVHDSGVSGTGVVSVFDGTQGRFFATTDSNVGAIASGYIDLSNAEATYHANFRVPIAGWKG